MKHTNLLRKTLAIVIGLALIAAMMIAASVTSSAADTTTTEVDLSGATYFTFSDTGITVTEGDYNGYKVSGTSLSIKDGGVYVVSGSCDSGTIVIKKNVKGVTTGLAMWRRGFWG